MKMKIVYSLLLSINMLLFLACDSDSGNSPLPVNPGSDEVKMDITILADDNFDEPTDGVLRDITVLAFVEKDAGTGKYYYAYQAVNAILTPVSGEVGKWKVSAIAKKMDGKKQKFAFLGNLRANSIAPTTPFTEAEKDNLAVTMQDALNRYTYTTATGWSTTAGGVSELFPMYGITQDGYNLTTDKWELDELNEIIYLFRMVAKLEIFLHEELTNVINFDFNDPVVLKNAKQEGYVCYNSGSDYMNYANYEAYYESSKETLHGLSAWIPTLPATALYNQNYNLETFTPNAADYDAGSEIPDCFKRISGNVYLHESGGYANKTKDVDTAPIYFEFTGTPVGGTETTFKLYLKADVLRNCQYRVVVYPPTEVDLQCTVEVVGWDTRYDMPNVEID